jgi:class 3 adenylate cyclase
LQTHISSLRRALGDGYVLTEGTGWTLNTSEIDAMRYQLAARLGREAIAGGDAGHAVARFDEALALWRGIPELPDSPRGGSEKTRWIEGHAALVEDRADALLGTGRAAEVVGELEAAIADAPLRERRWGQLMLALYRAGRQGEALAAYQRARSMLADELGVDPGPDLRRLEAAIVAQDEALEIAVSEHLSVVTRAVTFLLTDIEGSTAAWEADADAMAVALARHDEIVEQVVTSRGGRLVKTRGEGDATFSVFDRPSASAAAAIELQEAIGHEPWALAEPMRIRVALHTGEVELRDGDYFGRAVNRAARLRSLAAGGQIVCSGATAELVIDALADDVVLTDLGMRHLRNLARPEHVFELRLETAYAEPVAEAPMSRPALPAVLAGPGPFVGRGPELAGLLAAWQSTLAAGARAVLIAGEPGVGKTRLAGEWSRLAYEQGAVVLYGRCDEDLGAAYQPFAEALRSLMPCVGANRLRGLRGVEALLPLVPGLTDVVPDLPTPTRSDPDTERYALFDAVVALLAMASASAPVVLILDDLHWAAKPTLLLLRHLLRFGEHARVQIVGTYRSTDLDRSHPLAAMLADLHRDGSASRLTLGGLDEDDVTAYLAEAGYDDVELARALASVTGGNPFFLIEALRHVAESGGRWDSSTLPQGVREAVSRRLSRLPADANKALAAAAVVGSRFSLALVEQVVGDDLVDAFDEACKAGIVIEEPGGWYRFNHALVRQSLLAELASVRRMRLHQQIATTLEAESGADDELLAELAYHYFECAWAGNAAKAVEYCRRAADQAIERLAYEGAADLYDRALHALEELDDELPDRDAQQAELLLARCEALLAAGDVGSAAGAVTQLRRAAGDSVRLAAWGTCFDGQLSMLTAPERLDEIEAEVSTAAERLAELEDAAGEANAHTVRAACLARLGRIADCETALDQALTAARRARDHRRVNAVLAGAPLAALWGPNPVPRAGGRCLDVVRLLRITTGSPVVEATSTRCQGVLDAMRGRAAAGRQLIDSARRTLTELGIRHALLEVDQFAGIVELVADDPAAAEPYLRRAYDGFHRMGLDADTAETAAFLARTCLLLDRDAEADELCRESERLAGHALRPSITWRTVRAQLLARGGVFDEARRVAAEAVSIAERTDALVEHGDACLTLAVVLGSAGDRAGARAAAEQAVALFERKGAAALVEQARQVLGEPAAPSPASTPEGAEELANACVRAIAKLDEAIAGQAWDEVEQIAAPPISMESRRKIVGFSQIDARSVPIAEAGSFFEQFPARHHRVTLAVRGDRLALSRVELRTADNTPGAPRDEMLQLFGLNEAGRVALSVWFDVEDIGAAIAELDSLHARFEGAHARALDNECVRVIHRLDDAYDRVAWDEVEQCMAAVVSVKSHRKVVGQDPVDLPLAEWVLEAKRFREMLGGVRYRHEIVAVRGKRLALTSLKVGPTDQSPGAPRDELLQLYGVDEEGRVALLWWFDVDDVDAAIAELDSTYARLEEQAPRTALENAATRVDDRLITLFSGDRLDEVESLFTQDTRHDDRRPGLRRESIGRATQVDNIRAIGVLGVSVAKRTLALRGDRLCLSHIRFEELNTVPAAFFAEMLEITEADVDGLIAAKAVFDLDDFDAATADLDARYLAGEGAAHADTWQLIVESYATLNRREIPATTADWVNIDHRRGTPFAPGDLIPFVHASWEDMTDIRIYIAAVHRLTASAAVVTTATHGTSREGFDAEWREVGVLMFEGDRFSRCEMYDEDDLDVALARFDELTRPTTRPENAASRIVERYLAWFASRDWGAMGDALAPEVLTDDRRRVVNAGVRVGRDSEIANVQAFAALGCTRMTSIPVATRGERLLLTKLDFSISGWGESMNNMAMVVIETNAGDQMVSAVMFECDDIDAAFAELEARYLAGEGSEHTEAWSLIAETFAAANRHQWPPTTPDWVNIDHRRVTTIEAGDLTESFNAAFDVVPDLRVYVEAVHRLSDHAAVVTYAASGTSKDGFGAEWREIALMSIEGDKFSRNELFDGSDLDIALVTFDELSRQQTQLENDATRMSDRLRALFEVRDWSALSELYAEDVSADDRRRVIGGGARSGRDAEIANLRVMAELRAPRIGASLIAVRGRRLALYQDHVVDDDKLVEASFLGLIELNADGLIVGVVGFDDEDLDAAFAELEARYIAGEAGSHAHVWSVVTNAYALMNDRGLPATTPDWVNIDHRHGTTFAPGDLTAYIKAAWADLGEGMHIYVEAVHRLSEIGTVLTQVLKGASKKGFDAEWRTVNLYTVKGVQFSRCELYDEEDLAAAKARFDELSRPVRQLENAASRAYQLMQTHFSARDWDAMGQTMSVDIHRDDRRRVVNADASRDRLAAVAEAKAVAEMGAKVASLTTIAIRGDRLALVRARFSGRDKRPEAFNVETLCVVGIGHDGLIDEHIMFDYDHLDSALAELDARFLAGEAAPHASAWTVITEAYTALNRHELPPAASDLIHDDHHRLPLWKDDLAANMRAAWELMPDWRIQIVAVHRLTDVGAVMTCVAYGTSQQGFDAEEPGIAMLIIQDGQIKRFEYFDDADVDTALARFDELNCLTTKLANAATGAFDRLLSLFAIRDWDAMAEILAEGMSAADHRRVVNAGTRLGRAAAIASMQAAAGLGAQTISSTVIAIRGRNLALLRSRYSGRDTTPGAFHAEDICIVEIDADGRISAHVMFDLDDIASALVELDDRYMAGEAAPHSQAWSVIARGYAAFNRREMPKTTPDWANIDHRRGGRAFAPGDETSYIHATWDVAQQVQSYATVVHRLTDLGAVVSQVTSGTSHQGFDVEWQDIVILTVDGDLLNSCEVFDEADFDAALATFNELTVAALRVENAATRIWEQLADAFNRRDVDTYVDLTAPDGHFVDRRKGLRDSHEGSMRRRVVETLFEYPRLWRLGVETIAVRGSRFCLSRQTFRDFGDDDRPITVEVLAVTESASDGVVRDVAIFDPDDINAAFAELTARWIASGEVEHVEVIEAARALAEAYNRHDWDAVSRIEAGSTYVNHRQLTTVEPETIEDHWSSIRALASLIPDMRLEHAEILGCSTIGLVSYVPVKGTTADGAAVELPTVVLTVFDGTLVIHTEAFDLDQRDQALVRFGELNG